MDIRKYPNRRYYDATHSRHLTLEEIRSLIHEGHDLKVTDSKSGADITAQVLTQIILELETPKIDAFPTALLLQMIRSNDRAVRDFVERYFNQAFSTYLQYQKQMEEGLRHMQGMPGLFPPFGPWGQEMGSPWTPWSGAQPQPATGTTASAQKNEQPDSPQEIREMVSSLQRQLSELQEELKSKKPKRRRR